MPVWMVTGGSGFLGRHLLSALEGGRPTGVEVLAAGRRRPIGWPIEAFLPLDFDDQEGLSRAVRDISPSVVFHLAGRTPPAPIDDYYRLNTMATVRLLDALRSIGRPSRVVLVGSAAELGPVPVEDLPVGEEYPSRPVDAYGLSKLLATSAGLAARPPLEVVIARVFNPIGPGLPTSQALGRFAVGLSDGSGPVCLTVGDLDARRDFIDARDVARALLTLAERGMPGRIYHVGTGRSPRVGDGLDQLIALSGREVMVHVDPAIARSRGPSDSRADVRRVENETGWSAVIPWEQSLRDLWDDVIARSLTGLTDRRPSV